MLLWTHLMYWFIKKINLRIFFLNSHSLTPYIALKYHIQSIFRIIIFSSISNNSKKNYCMSFITTFQFKKIQISSQTLYNFNRQLYSYFIWVPNNTVKNFTIKIYNFLYDLTKKLPAVINDKRKTICLTAIFQHVRGTLRILYYAPIFNSTQMNKFSTLKLN